MTSERRHVTAELELTVEDDARLAFMIAVAAVDAASAERLEVTDHHGDTLAIHEVTDAAGTRLHVLDALPGSVSVRYSATVANDDGGPPVREVDLLTYLRPSRYCESDTLGPTALAEFAGLSGRELVDAVTSWVGTRLAYVPGSSQPTDGAEQTLLARQGVCRDYAHLAIALMRALDVPARLVSVYAPGLDPMDFHAVAEAYVEGGWHVFDATTLAPRGTLVRIATGRDAADTAFLSTYGGAVALERMHVTATADTLPTDDMTRLVELG